MDIDYTCCFTGHRKLPKTKIPEIVELLDKNIDELIRQGVVNFISGGALGFDQISASIVIEKKKKGCNIRLIFALPCINQDEKWNHVQKQVYRELLTMADEVIYISKDYDDSCMKKRNMYMVEHSKYCICALLNTFGGTTYTVNYAKKNNLKVINVAK